ncbi:MAG: glycoside hydrolase family 28 protein [Lachnospiraceae bacterium]|nr:glycoside hydrolase family 28 protein [Lachnospiraceae bacterium]
MIITEFRHLSHDGSDWTEAFEAAVAELAANGGGVLSVPPGVYPTGSIRLESYITLELQNGALLKFIDDEDHYPLEWLQEDGIPGYVHRACIFARNAEHVRVTGDGTMDGQGAFWWKNFKAKTLKHPRPKSICFAYCKDVKIEGITILNSPYWTVHPFHSEKVTVQGISIKNPWDSPNTDGINPECCRDVKIVNCTVDVGDDCITLKSATEDSENLEPCERIIVSGCHLLHGHGGIVLGSEMSGGVRNVVVNGCVFYETDRGIRLKTRRGRGGTVEGLQVFNLIMDGVMCPFVFNMYYHCGPGGDTDYVRSKDPQPVTEKTPALKDVSICNVSIRNSTACAGFFYGLPERPVEGITLRDIRVEMTQDGKPDTPAMMDDCPVMKGAGFYMRNAKNVRFENLSVLGLQGELVDKDDSVEVLI